MSLSDELTDIRGNRYATKELANAANRQLARDNAERAEREKRQADAFEAGLKSKFMSVPGTTEDDWSRNRQQVLDDARRKAALSEDDAACEAFSARYS